MKSLALSLIVGLTLVGCGSSMPPPTDRLANAEAAARSARELGAERTPNAALHLKLADEQIGQARTLMKDDEHKKADRVLQRAQSDAELAVMLAKEQSALGEAGEAKARVNQTKTTPPGAPQPMIPPQGGK